MNNCSDGSSNKCSSSKLYDQSIKSDIKTPLCCKENVKNGTTSHDEEFSDNQTDGCPVLMSLSSPPASSSSSYLNQPPSDRQNGECSGEKFSAKGRTLSSEENESKNNDKKRKTGYLVENDSSSENEGDEGLFGDDCCVYTYKGDQLADLPNSFFSVDMVCNGGHQPSRENHRKANNGREPENVDENNLSSSPEMDYLEMDFDPGPSIEQDFDEDLERSLNSPVPELPNDLSNNENLNSHTNNPDLCEEDKEFQPGPSHNTFGSTKKQKEISDCNSNSFNRTKGDCCVGFSSLENECCASEEEEEEEEVIEKKLGNGVDTDTRTDLILVGERLKNNVLSNDNKDLGASNVGNSKMFFDGIMLWSEQEAVSKQVTVVSSEVSCAATAVINAMLALKMRISIEKVVQAISSKLNTESASIPQYLISRSYAGVAHENLIQGIHHASHGLLYARFFQLHPRRDISLTKWLSHWMRKGAVPIATMNVQKESSIEESTYDTRHHQMIFGVNHKGIYLTNPIECLQEEELWNRLVTSSVLKIKRNEITSRWTPDSNLKPLMCQSDHRWKEMNVLGQVVNIIRESSNSGTQGKFLTQHISIPASSGITLVIERHSPGYEELVSTKDLPLCNLKSE